MDRIHLTNDQLNKLQDALGQPMTLDDALDVCEEYGVVIPNGATDDQIISLAQQTLDEDIL